MKKGIIAALILFVLAFITVLPAFAVSTAKLEASYGTPVVDGEIDGIWNNSAKADITKISLQYYNTTESATTGTLRTMWDENYFYILVEVDKHGVDYVWQSGAYDLAGNDTVCISLSLNGNCKAEANIIGGTDYCGGDMRSYDGGAYIFSGGWIPVHNNDENDGYSVKWIQKAVSGTTDKYVCEIAFPWADLTVGAGSIVGVEIAINSLDANNQRAGIIWAADDSIYYGWQSGDSLGQVTLLAKAESEPETEPETAPETEPETAPETSPGTEPEASPDTSDMGLSAAVGCVCAALAGIILAGAGDFIKFRRIKASLKTK